MTTIAELRKTLESQELSDDALAFSNRAATVGELIDCPICGHTEAFEGIVESWAECGNCEADMSACFGYFRREELKRALQSALEGWEEAESRLAECQATRIVNIR